MAFELGDEADSDSGSSSSLEFGLALEDGLAVGRGSASSSEVAVESASPDRSFSTSLSGTAENVSGGGFNVLYPPTGPSKVLEAVT